VIRVEIVQWLEVCARLRLKVHAKMAHVELEAIDDGSGGARRVRLVDLNNLRNLDN
jgi:hypothetical protein